LLQSFSWVLAEIAPYDHRHIIKGIMKEERRVGGRVNWGFGG